MKDTKRFMSFVKPYKWMVVLAVLIGVLKFLFPVFSPIIMQYTIDDILFHPSATDGEKTKKLIQIMSIVLFLYVIVRPVVEYYRQYYYTHVANLIIRDVRITIYQHLQTLNLRFFNTRKTGDIISRSINDVEQAKNFVNFGLMNMWIDLITVCIVLFILFRLHVVLTLVSLLVVPLYIASVRIFYRRYKNASKDRSKALGELQAFLHERIQGIAVIISFAREKEEAEKFKKENDNLFEKGTTLGKRNAQTFASTNTIAEISPMIVLLLAGLYVIEFDLTVGTLVAFVGLIKTMYTPLKRLADSSNILIQSIASIERIYELLDTRPEISDHEEAQDKTIKNGVITMRDVHFAYDSEKSILRNINLDVKSGQTVAFVGESGGGKSTLIQLIPRYYDATEGIIQIDGHSIKDYTLQSLRSQIGVVSQENILFNETILSNIKLGNPNATMEEVIEAAKNAQAHEFILSCSNGYETEIGERGVKLSGGQKQRIALARVFLKNPSILILDEATSALDLENERHIQEALHTLSRGRTTLVIAHRLSTIVDADKIVYLENGCLLEEGTHQELLRRKGKYFHLYQKQKIDTTV